MSPGLTCDGARDARIWGEAKTTIRNKADMTERLGPGQAGQPLTEFLDLFKMFKIKMFWYCVYVIKTYTDSDKVQTELLKLISFSQNVLIKKVNFSYQLSH